MDTQPAGYGLAHPVYLDVPMMLSFLAHLEGGVSVSETATTTATGARERFLMAQGGVRARLAAIGSGDLEAKASTQNRDETQTESATERHHTEASLFNLLYHYLTEDQQVVRLATEGQLAELYSGQLVELSGEYLGNSIENILAFFDAVMPYVEDSAAQASTKSASQASKAQMKRSGNPAVKASADGASGTSAARENTDNDGIRIIKRMSEDMKSAPVHDLLFRTEDGLEAVITAASRYYSATTLEYLRAGEFRVMGKVTKVLTKKDSINLTRRTVMGAAGPEAAQSLMGDISRADDVSLDVPNPIVRGPAVQILPMAIFI